ncbi:hypothetical protein, partial [Bacillus altitudinis]|uniref:hypothetical protein n=1 Tax=Bacillus altitudinis TaxID=293387 RepID=UPI001C92E59C
KVGRNSWQDGSWHESEKSKGWKNKIGGGERGVFWKRVFVWNVIDWVDDWVFERKKRRTSRLDWK